MTINLPIGTELRITSTGGEHFFPVGTLVRVTGNSDPECPLLVGEYLATTLDPFADNDWEEGVTAYVLTSGEDKNAEVTGGEMIRDPATIRSSWDDDADVTRIVRRVHAALNSGTDRAVVAVVLDETDKARAGVDELRASVTEYEGSLQAAQSRLARVRELADAWPHADTCGSELSPGAGYPCSCWKAALLDVLGVQR